MSARVIAPGRRILMISPRISTTVLSRPISQGPPSRIISTSSRISGSMWSAEVGLSPIKTLALGAAMGHPESSITDLAIGWRGILIATESNPPVVSLGIPSAFGSTMVRGPGQYALARRSAVVDQLLVKLLA